MRRIILSLITPKKVFFINHKNDIDLIRLVLKSTKKGNGIEEQFATDAWKPIYNVESMDGNLWLRLHKKVLKIIHTLKLDDIKLTTLNITNTLMDKTDGMLTSRDISLLPARIFFKSIFGKEIPINKYDLFYSSSIEWRKEVALKSKGDKKIKNTFMEYISDNLKNIYLNDLIDIETISSFIQPFFISPMINFSDIYVSIFYNLKNHPDLVLKKQSKEYYKNIIMESIRLSHPFPILERELLEDILYNNKIYKKGSHFYIELDSFIQDNNFEPNRWNDKHNIYSIIPFGSGPRQCIGKILAMSILSESLYTIINHPNFELTKIKVECGHLYSGRNNDNNTSIKELFYILNKFLIKLTNIMIK